MPTNTSIATVGRVCLCDWTGPVTVTMVVSLLSHLKQFEKSRGGPVVLIINLRLSSATSIMMRSSSFLDALPALWTHCQEVVFASEGESAVLEQLRRYICGSVTTPVATLSKPLGFFDVLDDAFTHVQGVFPHDVLELRRQRLRSGSWQLSEPGDCRVATRG